MAKRRRKPKPSGGGCEQQMVDRLLRACEIAVRLIVVLFSTFGS